MGAVNQAKGRVGRRQKRQAPRRRQRLQGRQAAKKASSPNRFRNGKVSRRPTGQAPAGRVVRPCSQHRGGGTKPSRGGATANKPPRNNPGWLVKPVPVATEQPAQTAAYRITLSDRSPSAVSQYRSREPFSAPR